MHRGSEAPGRKVNQLCGEKGFGQDKRQSYSQIFPGRAIGFYGKALAAEVRGGRGNAREMYDPEP